MNTIKAVKTSFYLSIFMSVTSLAFLVPSLIFIAWKSPLTYFFEVLMMYIPVFALYGFLIYKSKVVYKLKGIYVFEDYFEFEYRKHSKKIYYKDILKMKVLHKKIGSYKIFTAQESFEIAPTNFELKKISYLTEALYLSRPDLLSVEDFSDVRAQNLYFKDTQYKYESLISLLPLLFIFGIYLLHSQSFYTPDFLTYLGSAVLVFGVIPFVPFCVSESWFAKKVRSALAEKIKTSPIDSDFIKGLKLWKMKRTAFVLAFILPYYAVVYKYDLNFLDYKESRWIDERYGKNESKFKLEKDQHIYFRDDYDGIIIAVPGESVAVNVQQGRKLASEQLVQVPPREYGIRSGDSVLLVKEQHISGKVIQSLEDFF